MTPRLPFRDRREAGAVLAGMLDRYAGHPDVLVLGLPRGGVPVAFEVAARLGAALDVFIVRKLGVPGQEELAFGAVASGGVRVLNYDVVRSMGIPQHVIDAVAARETEEIRRREILYRENRPSLSPSGRPVVLVDDGLATGATMLAGVRALRAMNVRRLVAAVPVGSREACGMFRSEADEVVCAAMPEPFRAVGLWYENFDPTTDNEVVELLETAARTRAQ